MLYVSNSLKYIMMILTFPYIQTKRHTKQSVQSSTDRLKRTHKKTKHNHGTKRNRPKKKHGKQRIKDGMVPDVTDNASEDRWRTQKLKQLPGVARLVNHEIPFFPHLFLNFS